MTSVEAPLTRRSVAGALNPLTHPPPGAPPPGGGWHRVTVVLVRGGGASPTLRSGRNGVRFASRRPADASATRNLSAGEPGASCPAAHVEPAHPLAERDRTFALTGLAPNETHPIQRPRCHESTETSVRQRQRTTGAGVIMASVRVTVLAVPLASTAQTADTKTQDGPQGPGADAAEILPQFVESGGRHVYVGRPSQDDGRLRPWSQGSGV